MGCCLDGYKLAKEIHMNLVGQFRQGGPLNSVGPFRSLPTRSLEKFMILLIWPHITLPSFLLPSASAELIFTP